MEEKIKALEERLKNLEAYCAKALHYKAPGSAADAPPPEPEKPEPAEG